MRSVIVIAACFLGAVAHEMTDEAWSMAVSQKMLEVMNHPELKAKQETLEHLNSALEAALASNVKMIDIDDSILGGGQDRQLLGSNTGNLGYYGQAVGYDGLDPVYDNLDAPLFPTGGVTTGTGAVSTLGYYTPATFPTSDADAAWLVNWLYILRPDDRLAGGQGYINNLNNEYLWLDRNGPHLINGIDNVPSR